MTLVDTVCVSVWSDKDQALSPLLSGAVEIRDVQARGQPRVRVA